VARRIHAGASVEALKLQPAHPPQPVVDASTAYRYYVLAAIWLVLLLRFIDIQIIAVLLESIRAEFRVSDTQLGLLSGTAFALFYVTLGVPVALVADRYNRRSIIVICLSLWSAMTALCGMASSFGGLLLARIGVGVGEAGGAPPAYSLISDYFPAARRATIFAFLNSSVPMGVFAGFILGGYINVRFGWRATLLIVGLGGLLVALLVRLTVREPARGAADGERVPSLPPRFGETLRNLWRTRSYRHLVAASSIATMGASGTGIWIASFFIRVHEMPPAEVTTSLAFTYGGGGVAGAMLGGALADRLVSRTGDARWHARLSAVAMMLVLPSSFFVYLWPHPASALLMLGLTTCLLHAWMGPTYGTVQSLARPDSRALAAAVNLFVVNLLALGFGPLLVGAMSDLFTARFGKESLRYSILTLASVTYPWAAIHFLRASRTLRQDLQPQGQVH
jgi:predicted MFS family arabinose efflux permease